MISINCKPYFLSIYNQGAVTDPTLPHSCSPLAIVPSMTDFSSTFKDCIFLRAEKVQFLDSLNDLFQISIFLLLAYLR